MRSLTICLLLALCLELGSAGRVWGKGSKIVGGVETTIEDVPFQLQMEIGFLGILWSFSCGAVIIGPNTVLTAGHCVEGQNANNMRFRSGNKNRGTGTLHTVETFELHPGYTDMGGYADNDIAILKVTPDFLFGTTTQAIGLRDVQSQGGENATVSGWGTTSESASSPAPIVRKVEVPVIDIEKCKSEYSGEATVTDNMICAGYEEGGKDSCSGDSGGPFVVDGKLAGLVSWGQGCAEAGYPGVYTNVVNYLPWIETKMAEFSG